MRLTTAKHRSPILALTDTLTLDNSTGVESTFNILFRDKTSTERVNTGGTLTEPGKCVVKHTSSGQGANVVDRHLIQFSQLKQDAAGVNRTATVNLTMAVPRSSVITNTIVYDLISFLVDLVCDGSFSAAGIGGTTNLAQLLRNES